MEPVCGGEELIALNAKDGQLLWRYDVTGRTGLIMYNVMPALIDDRVYFADFSGGLYCLDWKTGKEIWYEPGATVGSWSTGGMAAGPNNLLYTAVNHKIFYACQGEGILRAQEISTGKVRWQRTWPYSLNVAPAIGKLSNGRTAVIIVAGHNPMPFPLPWWMRPYQLAVHLMREMYGGNENDFLALDPETGETIWSLKISAWVFSTEGTRMHAWCAPDISGTPAIGADGTVYVSWSGGKVLALNDANNDGKIDMEDPKEYSSYHHGEGANGEPAIGPGYIVVPTCHKLLGYAK